MYGVAIAFGSGWRPDWVPMANVEMTAGSRPACGTPGWVFSARVGNRAAYEKKRRVRVVAVRSNIFLVKLPRFLAISGVEVGARIVCSQRSEKSFESGIDETPSAVAELGGHTIFMDRLG